MIAANVKQIRALSAHLQAELVRSSLVAVPGADAPGALHKGVDPLHHISSRRPPRER